MEEIQEPIDVKNPFHRKKIYKRISNIIFILLTVFLLFEIILKTCFFISIVDGESMLPNLKHNQVGYTDQSFYKISGLKRFDIIVVDRGEGIYYVKRIIGLPNETISYHENTLYVNNKAIKEKFIEEEAKKETCTRYINTSLCNTELTLGSKEYFIMGDNRGNSEDSRSFGAIKYSEINGRGFILYGTCVNADCSKIKRIPIKIIQ